MTIVKDGALPHDGDWMFVKMDDGGLMLVMTRSGVNSPEALADAWAAYRSIERPKPAPIPSQRLRLAVRAS